MRVCRSGVYVEACITLLYLDACLVVCYHALLELVWLAWNRSAVSRSPVLCTCSAAVFLGGHPRWRAGGFQTEQ